MGSELLAADHHLPRLAARLASAALRRVLGRRVVELVQGPQDFVLALHRLAEALPPEDRPQLELASEPEVAVEHPMLAVAAL
jgi:hypothetical protein